jgi:hypothetical protein
MRREKYKKFVINPRAIPLAGVLGWSAEFDLEKHGSDDVIWTPFAVLGTYASEESAIMAANMHGRMKIDDGFRTTP